MENCNVPYKVECALQKVEEYIQKIRETGDLFWLTRIVWDIVHVQNHINSKDRS